MEELSKVYLFCELGLDPQYLWPSSVMNLVASVSKLYKSKT